MKVVGICYFLLTLLTPYDQNIDFCFPLNKASCTDRAQSVDAESMYLVGSHCTKVSTQQPMQNDNFDQSEPDTVFFSAYAVLRESGYNVIDTADTLLSRQGSSQTSCGKRRPTVMAW